MMMERESMGDVFGAKTSGENDKMDIVTYYDPNLKRKQLFYFFSAYGNFYFLFVSFLLRILYSKKIDTISGFQINL